MGADCCGKPQEKEIKKAKKECSTECCAPAADPALASSCETTEDRCDEANDCYQGETRACCSEDRPSTTESEAAACCGNEERCDKECIMAVAAYECETACDQDSAHDATGVGTTEAEGHHHSHDANGKHPTAACNDHLRSAYDQYASYIAQARCICRSILERGMSPNATCCSTKKSKSKTYRKKSPAASRSSLEVKGHSHVHTGRSDHRHHHHHQHDPDHASLKQRRRKDEAGKKIPASSEDDAISPVVVGSCGTKKCCDDTTTETKPPPATTVKPLTSRPKGHDVESDAGLESVAINISGMDCSGCGDKVTRALESLPGVSQVRVNFIMSNADFSIDPRVAKAEDVIRATEGVTGFRCTRVAGGDHALDLLVSGTAQVKALQAAAVTISGITDVTVIDKKLVRLSYDPAIIGARDLFESLSHDRCDGLAPPRDDPAVASSRKRLMDQLIKTTLAAILTIPVVVLAWGDTLVEEKTKAIVSIVLATFVQFVAVPEFYYPAISALVRSHVLEMDMLVVISITAAYLYSLIAFGFRMADQPLDTAEFFETSTLLITLILLGRLIATWARVKAVSAVSLRSLQTNTAILVVAGAKDREIDARLLQHGDEFKVAPHSRVPTDGVVLSGSSDIDESMLTGEPMPVLKQPGDGIIAGTVNGGGTVVARLSRLPGKNTVTDIAQLVEDAANSKPKIQDLANKVASWFVPVVSGVAILVIVVWVVVGLKVRSEPGGKAVSDAITYAVAVLAVSCPCALGLAVPMVLVIAGGIAARGGIVIKSADCTERARKCTDVIFDKTGTITEGELDVIAHEYLISDKNEAETLSRYLVAGGKHPVSAAVDAFLGDATTAGTVAGISEVSVVPGAGVEATSSDGGQVLRAGNPKWTRTEEQPAVVRFRDQGLTTLVVTRDNTPLAAFGLRTQLRPEAIPVINELKSRNITVHLVSGDQTSAVSSVASAVGIPLSNVAAERTPSEKRDYVASVMEDPTKYVMFCGDGTNDAVAVAQAHVGAQMGGALSSSDVTQGAADVVLMNGLDGIPFLLNVSRAAFNRMVFNFVWSAVYNVLAILLAAGAFVNFRIPPAYAGLGEIVSVLPVIFAAMSMLLLNLRTNVGS